MASQTQRSLIQPEPVIRTLNRPAPAPIPIHSAHHPLPTASRYIRYGKRPLDCVVAAILLILLSPVLFAAMIAIRIESPGSPIFRQRRLGLDGSTFVVLKLRTMVHDAEVVLLENPQLRDAMAVRWKLERDPRVTRLGRFLRRFSIDELPQLINVLRGEMSMVGPRPYLTHELDGEFRFATSRITSVKPGMTGLWQISGRSTLTPAQRVHLDAEYASSVSFSNDLRIMLRTVWVVLRWIGAH